MKKIFLFLWLIHAITFCSGQISEFPYRETFDSTPAAALPTGWLTSKQKNPGGDFLTAASSPRSVPHALSSADATRPQFVILPEMNFVDRIVDSLEFFERRTSSYQARILVEASIGGDTLFGIRVSPDSLRSSSTTSYVRRAFALPETLSGMSQVRIRIRNIPDTAGATGIIRIDDVRLTVKIQKDLSLVFAAISPLNPKQGEMLTLFLWVKNRAAAGKYSGSLRLFDSLELVSSASFSELLGENDSVMLQMQYPSLSAGRHPLMIELQIPGDEDTSNNFLSALVHAGYRTGTLLINEFMYLPPAGMPEWIEIVNRTGAPVPLSGWKISDGGSTKGALTPAGRILPPYSYAVITTDTNGLKNFVDIPVQLFQASFSSLNNSGDGIILFDPTNSAIDSLLYLPSWGSSAGRTLERIDTGAASTLQSNWRLSNDPSGGTPGAINSVTPKEFDLTVIRIEQHPAIPRARMENSVTVTVRNIGKKSVAAFTLQLYRDGNADSLFSMDDMIGERMISGLSPGDSASVLFMLPPLHQGSHRIAAMVNAETDKDRSNDQLVSFVRIGAPMRSIVINEVMYAPGGDIPEWIEGYNRSNEPVSLSGWKISDNGSTKAVLSGDHMIVQPFHYFIITTDTLQFLTVYRSNGVILQAPFSGLNNTTPDAAVLYDERGMMMDSLYYRPTWGGMNGTTLQRFDTETPVNDSSNWKTGPPDPWSENGIARKEFDAEIRSFTVTRQTEGIAIRTMIFNAGRNMIEGAHIRIVHDRWNNGPDANDEILYTAQITQLNPHDSIVFTAEWRTPLHGTQRLTVECVYLPDERIGNNLAAADALFAFPERTLAVNEIMYEPSAGGSEFIELINRSTDTVDVSGWKLMEGPGSSGSRTVILLSDSLWHIPPNGFLVAASDSAFLLQHPYADKRWTVIAPSLSLSNGGEDIVLHDLTGTVIDSVRYSPQWHLKNLIPAGRSLERINPALGSNDGTNWSTSVAGRFATPLLVNSIYTPVAASGSSIRLSPNPFSPDHDGHEDFLTINYTLPSVSSTIRIRIFDVTGRLIRRLVQGEASASTGTALWDGLDDDGRRVRIGIYVILLEALDNFGATVRTLKDAAVVARKL